MKRMICLFSVLLCLLMLTGTALAAEKNMSAQAQQQTQSAQPMLVHDQANVMSDSERRNLETRLEELSAKYGIQVAVWTMKQVPQSMTIKSFADRAVNQYYSRTGNPEAFAGSKGAIIFVQATGERQYAVSTDVDMRKIITDEGGYPYLEQAFLPYLQENNYYQAYNSYADGVGFLLDKFIESGKPYEPSEEFNLTALILAVIFAGVVGYGVYAYLVNSMSNVKSVPNAREYLDRGSVNISRSQDLFLYTTRRVVHHPRNNNSGGGGGGGNGGGSGRY